MAGNYEDGVTDQDELGQYPSAASPLAARGIDPYEVRSNPQLLQQLSPWGQGAGDFNPASAPGVAAPSESAWAAGTDGGAAAAPAVSVPIPTPQPSEHDYGMEGLGDLATNLRKATGAADAVPTSSSQVDALAQQRQRIASPIPLYDPSTGKMLDETTATDADGSTAEINPKASLGRKIWRGVRGGLTGLAIGGIPGALVGGLSPEKINGAGNGYEDPSLAYQKAEQRRQQELSANTDASTSAMANWKQAVDAQKAKAAEYRATGTLGKDLTSGAKELMEVPINQETADAEKLRAQNESPDAKLKLSQDEFNQRTQQSQRLRLNPTQRAIYIATGKVPDPQQETEAEFKSAAVAKAIKALGHQPANLEELNQVMSAAAGGLDKGTGKGGADKDDLALLSNAQKELASALRQPPVYTPEGKKTRQDAIDKAQKAYDDAYAKVQAKTETPDAANHTPPPPGATDEVYAADGKTLIGHVVGGVYQPLGSK